MQYGATNHHLSVEGGKHLLPKEKFLGTGEGFTVCSWIHSMNRDFRSYTAFLFFLLDQRGRVQGTAVISPHNT